MRERREKALRTSLIDWVEQEGSVKGGGTDACPVCVCVLHTEIEEKSMRAVTRRLERVLSMQLKKAVACLHAAAQTKLTRDEKRAVKERPISVDRRSHSVEGRIMQQRIRIKQGAK